MSQRSLSTLVAIYRRKYGPQIAGYLAHFQMLKSLDDAIRFACHGKEGRIHDYQRLVGKKKLEQARQQLQKHADQIAASGSFSALLALVKEHTGSIDRFGELAIYDTSLRLGAYLGDWPEVVYLHAGTKKGCKALGVATSGGEIEMQKLPKPIQSLEPYEAEDFLCIFKDQFS
jgi:hypothetical protein